jgi:hypothetical protein
MDTALRIRPLVWQEKDSTSVAGALKSRSSFLIDPWNRIINYTIHHGYVNAPIEAPELVPRVSSGRVHHSQTTRAINRSAQARAGPTAHCICYGWESEICKIAWH